MREKLPVQSRDQGLVYHLSYRYLGGQRLSPAAGGACGPRRRRRHYLEAMELEWDWLEEVVAALSWEKPLWLDSRLVMEPLKSSEPMTSV